MVGRLIAQLLPAAGERCDGLAELLLLVEREPVGVGFGNALDCQIEFVELPFGLRQDLRSVCRRKLKRDSGEIDETLRGLVDDVACKFHVRNGLLDLGDTAAQVAQFQDAERHRNSASATAPISSIWTLENLFIDNHASGTSHEHAKRSVPRDAKRLAIQSVAVRRKVLVNRRG
jgi:hypothetical protein